MLRVQTASASPHHLQQQRIEKLPSRIMTERKARNRNVFTLENKMEIRGISSRTDQHPLPEKPGDSIPLAYLQTVKEAISQYITPSVSSSRCSPTNVDTRNFFMLSNSGWTTGNSTERSSLFSWADDEFDKQAARTVRRMFDEIDSMLFEFTKPTTASSTLQNECKDWKNSFPHLRILGEQLLPPGDDGYQLYPQDTSRPPTAGMLMDIPDYEVPENSLNESQGLNILGKHVDAINLNTESLHCTSSSTNLSFLEEEIIESDGLVEEYLAYDSCWHSDEEGFEQKFYHAPRRRQGFPPITPNACRHNSISSHTFDVLWEEIVGWLRLPLRKSLEERTSHEDSHSQVSNLHHVAPSFDLGMIPYGSGYPGGTLLDAPMGKLAPMGSALRFGTTPLNFNKNSLTGVMTISSKALHNRLGDKDRVPPLLGDEQSPFLTYQRPGSSSFLPKTARPGSTCYSNRMSSARGGKGRLKPLERAKTPAIEGGVTGKKIMTVSERLSSPPQVMSTSPPRNWSRNATLPPIESMQEGAFPRDAARQLRGNTRMRISSAQVDDRRPPTKERVAPFVFDTRPNTTHSFRTDTPFGLIKRSSTPLSQNLNILKPGTPQGNPSIMTGITGVSLGIPGSSSQLENQYAEQQPQGYLRLF